MLLTDFYKTIHHKCYPPGMTQLVSYWTPRMSRLDGVNDVVMFGLQGFIRKYLIDYFNDNFFNKPKQDNIDKYYNFIKLTMGEDYADCKHIEQLYNLGYLPIQIKAIKEGTLVPIKVPMIEITNTHPDFAWLVNYIETLISANIWFPITCATIAYNFRKIINEYYDKTVVGTPKHTACGNFDMRGQTSIESACYAGAGHLLSFSKTATIPAILYLQKYYNCNIYDDLIGTGTASTEHSVMTAYGENEINVYKRLLAEVFPKGVLSIVSDSYDYWNVIINILPEIKDIIINREGKVLIRGDSGDPVKIICGDFGADPTKPEYKGTVELLWEIFGGYINGKGYKVLDSHIRTIYGDSITLERCNKICKQLEEKGFATENVIFGVGSYSYQYNTRDTFGFALKATHAIIDGKETFIYKDPKTDNDNFKKSQKGICVVFKNIHGITYLDNFNLEMAKGWDNVNLLEPVFKNGILLRKQSLNDIRDILHKGEF
jgi:nicotinamide phosphoribosyltransferase